ncbi:Serine/threonine-protein kinase Haspin [Rhynchospora pubera]|uniref:non-specific serine/threonine protein kinase n=1 Tax=Rhynchospora pubera TaxID=906938 RepID=A0AAV8DA09_9POAL|nr:Serine/threonine-protein kinase Haspin [Rhynchospora pubera]KAJ4815582.1 Serine/threonine-protein kinase Haspin [Rhynchospora pubera]
MASRQDPWMDMISEEGDDNAVNPQAGVVYGRRRTQAKKQSDAQISLSRRQNKGSFVTSTTSSWSHSLSIRGRESIVIESKVNLQLLRKPKGPSKRPPKPTLKKKQDPSLPDLTKEKEYFKEVDAFELLEETPSPLCTTWTMGVKQQTAICNLSPILSRWGLSTITETPLDEPAEKFLLPIFDKLAIEEREGEGAGTETEPHLVQQGLLDGEDECASAFTQLLMVCKQTAPVSLHEVLSAYSDPCSTKKLGEGTYGEAYRVGSTVCKIVPIDGDILVNNEVQKKSKEVLEEALLTSSLNNLRKEGENSCTGFIDTIDFRVCKGAYDAELIRAWEDWDAENGSENDHPKIFSDEQCYIVFVLADGGRDLESFVLLDYKEAQSLLLQVTASLSVAEAACEFEHRDLHWGNILLSRDNTEDITFILGRKKMKATTFGLRVSIIDFTLSRINTGDAILFLDLSADPELFMGEKGNKQFDTYRAMKKVTKDCWGGSFPKTNVLWLIYLVDILLLKKTFKRTTKDERELRSFKKRMSSYQSARDCLVDSFFTGLLLSA